MSSSDAEREVNMPLTHGVVTLDASVGRVWERRTLANANINVLNGADGLGQIAAGLVGQGLTIFDSIKRNISDSAESAAQPAELSENPDDGDTRPSAASLSTSTAQADLDRAARADTSRGES